MQKIWGAIIKARHIKYELLPYGLVFFFLNNTRQVIDRANIYADIYYIQNTFSIIFILSLTYQI